MAANSHFRPALFTFLRDLAANNDRDWFKANKARYEEHIKDASIRFITDFAPLLKKVSPHFRADPRPVGGSLFRIYRDTRFSKDKSPYKTHVGIHFRHEDGKDVHAPGFYLHLEPKESFLGAGIWHPDTANANRIRTAIVDDPDRWKRLMRRKSFADFELVGDSLKRPPRGFDREHPLIDDLKRKDFLALTPLTQKAVTSTDFVKTVAAQAKKASAMVEFLCDAVGVRF